jgi:hypothetical protein
MRSLTFMVGIGAVGALSALVTAASCAADAGSEPAARLGVARQREDEDDWKLLGADFNGDGLGDALWYSTAGNRIALGLRTGGRPPTPGPELPGPGLGWAIASFGDFNRDGMIDVLWGNSSTGQMSVWLMRGAQVLAPGPEVEGPLGDGWRVWVAADFDADGMADALWFNAATNRIAVWLMNGTQLLARGAEIPGPPGDGWTVVTGVDFNGDGMSDVLWNNPGTNRIAVWLMRSVDLLAAGPEIEGPPGGGWTVANAGDFNLDGMADVLWQNTDSGEMAVWLMHGAQLLAPGPMIHGPPGDGWSIANDFDMNNDGMTDAVWQQVGPGNMAVWLMRGVDLLAAGPVIQGPGGMEPLSPPDAGPSAHGAPGHGTPGVLGGR